MSATATQIKPDTQRPNGAKPTENGAGANGKPDAAANGNGRKPGDERESFDLAIDKIVIEPGFNPRGEFKDEPLDGLRRTIRTVGFLEPLLVELKDDGTYVLRDGERRLRAAKAEGLTVVPVTTRILADKALLAALITDATKEGLSPVEQARGYRRLIEEGAARNMTEVAEKIGRKAPFVRERLRLLDLPDDVQEHIHDGKVPLALAPTLERMAKVSGDVASAAAALVARGSVPPGVVVQRPWDVVRAFEGFRWPGGKPVAVESNTAYPLIDLPIPGDAKDVGEWIEQVHKDEPGNDTVRFGTEAIDAARAFGCLLEYKTEGQFPRKYGFICNAAFIADLLRSERERRKKEAARLAKEAEKRAAEQARAGSASGPSAEEKAKEERRKQREEAERQKGLARNANVDLWKRLNEQPKKAMTVDDLRPLVYAAMANDAPKIAARLAYCRPDWQNVEVKKVKGKDREKVTYPTPQDAAALLFAWLDEAKTPAELLRRANIALIGATYADNRCEPNSRRIGWRPPNSHNGGHDALDRLKGMIAKLAKGKVPKRLTDRQRSPY